MGFYTKKFNLATMKYKVVFHLNENNPNKWEALIGNIGNLIKEVGEDHNIDVVVHGDGINFLLKNTATLEPEIKKFDELGVTFIACRNTLKHHDLSEDELIPTAAAVNSGVAYIVEAQANGYQYIKI